MDAEQVETPRITERERDITLARLRALFGGPPPADMLALAEERWDRSHPDPRTDRD